MGDQSWLPLQTGGSGKKGLGFDSSSYLPHICDDSLHKQLSDI